MSLNAKELVDALAERVFKPWSEEQLRRMKHVLDRVHALERELREHLAHAHGPQARIAGLRDALKRTPGIAGSMTGPRNTPDQASGYTAACNDIRAALQKHVQEALDE